ncbi:unnamed protein product, partial [marine sediment metagenome]
IRALSELKLVKLLAVFTYIEIKKENDVSS